MRRLGRLDLLRSVQRFPRSKAQAVLDALFGRPIYDITGWADFAPGVLAEALSMGDRVSMRGYFAMELRRRRPRVGRNPRTGQAVTVKGYVTAAAVFPDGFLCGQQKPLGRLDFEGNIGRSR